MNSLQTLTTIKTTVNRFLPGSQVFVYGSRARGDAQAESDYDLLVVTGDNYGQREKMDWENKIRKALVNALDLPFDVIMQSKTELELKKNIHGHIVYFAMKEAIEI